MPNVQITLYLNEEDYKKYLKDKEEYNTIARTALKVKLHKK